MSVTVASLKNVKNAVIGNPVAKESLARDSPFVATLIDCLSDATLATEAAHVIASLSLGSDVALLALLRAHAPRATVYALSLHQDAQTRTALARALRTLCSSAADAAGPPMWGLRKEPSPELREVASVALDAIISSDALDVYLPFLTTPTATATSVAQLLGSVLRTPSQRNVVTLWSPSSPTSPSTTTRSKRGWEKMAQTGVPTVPIVAKWLVALLGSEKRDSKMMEAVLLALAALTKENVIVAGYLGKNDINTISTFANARSPDVQVAACLCLTHTLRSLPPRPPSGASSASYSLVHSHSASSSGSVLSLEEVGVRTVLNVINRMISSVSTASEIVRMRACFVLYHLVVDDDQLCHTALDRGCLDTLGALILSLSPQEPAPPEWEEGEAASRQDLREAAFTALASLALASDDIRRRISGPLALLPTIARALRATMHVGTRYAACQCVRAMSRSVSVLRTGVVDSGLGMDVLRVLLGQPLGERFGANAAASSADRTSSSELNEDRRVLGAALSAVCNIVNDFSPLRPIYLEEKLMPRLVLILRTSGDPTLCVNALWAVKNLVRKASNETKRDVMRCLGWESLTSYLTDADIELQEQALNILRNLSENEEGISLVLSFLPASTLLPHLVPLLRSPAPDVVHQATAALANLANGPSALQSDICGTPGLLAGLARVLEGAGGGAARAPAVGCVLALAKGDPRRRAAMSDAGVLGTLRRVAEWGGGVSFAPPPPPMGSYGSAGASPGGGVLHSALGARSGALSAGHAHAAVGLDEEREVVNRARMALEWLEHGEMYP